MSQEPLIELLFDRLATDHIPTATADAVLAAVSGDDDLAAALAGEPTRLDPVPGDEVEPHAAIYLSSITVAGFRGVGPERTLPIAPGPGLTVVVGRNGSGKSSFAEAIELSLTGASARWADRASVWRQGWRNLHAPSPCTITTELRIDGAPVPTRVRRSWAAGAELTEADVSITSGPGRFGSLADMGLTNALRLYRPFLTAADLGKLVAGTPSDLFDAIDAILGLDALTIADKRLMAAVRPLDTVVKDVRARRAPLAERLVGIDDDRARRAAAVLAQRAPDLDLLDAILAEPIDAGSDDTITACHRLRDVVIPDLETIELLARDLHKASAAAKQNQNQNEQASVRVAEMLRLALDHRNETGDRPCPICGTGILDAAWHTTATASLADLRTATLAARRTGDQLAATVHRARETVTAVRIPVVSADVRILEQPLTLLREAITRLHAAPTGDPDALADHLTVTYPSVVKIVADVQSEASGWLEQRDSAWRRIADDVRLWVAAARQVPDHQRVLTTITDARAWLKNSAEALRNERVAPFAEHSQRIWRQLRQESNVELGTMTLAGANTRRRIVFPVSVDGADNGTALGVMSQGELHALGLATFLPRSCAKESPFRFVVIDDPVQSMDPAKVDGLARVLAEIAADRQIVVFTHDSRLPDAIRMLEIDAEIVEVLRAEQSVITLRPAMDVVSRYLKDADAVALSSEIPDDVRGPVVAELCRSGLEAACHRVVWRHRLAAGQRHADIETTIGDTAKSVTKVFALALFNDAGRGGDVLSRLNNHYGSWAADAYQACRKGVHGSYVRDLRQLVRDCRRLAEGLT